MVAGFGPGGSTNIQPKSLDAQRAQNSKRKSAKESQNWRQVAPASIYRPSTRLTWTNPV